MYMFFFLGLELLIFLFLFLKFLFYIGLQLIYNVLVSGIRQSDSVIHVYIQLFFFQALFPFRLLQNIEQSSLCSAVGPYWLSILNTVVCASFCWFLDFTCKQYHMIFVFLYLTYFTQYDNLQVHPCCCKGLYFICFNG